MSLLSDLRGTRFTNSPLIRDPTGIPAIPVHRRDSSVLNPLTGLGSEDFDKGSSARPNIFQLPLTTGELDALFQGNGLTKRILQLLPSRATRRGWTVPDIGAEDRRLGTWNRVRAGQTWADLYGGAIGVVVTEDDVPAGMDSVRWLAEPLELARVGRVLALQIFDAIEAVPLIWEKDIRKPGFGMPVLWSVSSSRGFRGHVHASRVLHFRGAQRPPSRLRSAWQSTSMPDDSMLQAIWDEIRRLSEISAAGATIAQELRQGVLHVSGLASKSTSDEGETLWTRLRETALLKSILGMLVVDKDESYENISQAPTGYSELSEGGWTALSAATGIPQTILQGESPGGLSSDGESAQEGFRQLVSDYAETRLRDPLEQFYRIVLSAQDGPTGGVVPDETDLVTFEPLDEPNEKAVAETELIVVQADEIRIRSGVVDPETITRSRYGEDGWNLELQASVVPDESDVEAEVRAALASSSMLAPPVPVPGPAEPEPEPSP